MHSKNMNLPPEVFDGHIWAAIDKDLTACASIQLDPSGGCMIRLDRFTIGNVVGTEFPIKTHMAGLWLFGFGFDPTGVEWNRCDPTPNTHSVYYMIAGDHVKIGYADNVQKRHLLLQTGCPLPLKIAAIEPGSVDVESMRHRQFQHLRFRGEWFHLTDELAAHIKQIAEGGSHHG